MLQRTVPVSSVLHSIAANYKVWKTRCIWREDSFYIYYFKSTKCSATKYNTSEQNILLSGDVELNPGPAIAENISAIKEVSFIDVNFELECRMLRYRLIPLVEEVIVFSNLYHISYVVIQVVIWNLELQELGIWQKTQNDSKKVTQRHHGCSICLVCQCKEHGLIILSYKPWLMQWIKKFIS